MTTTTVARRRGIRSGEAFWWGIAGLVVFAILLQVLPSAGIIDPDYFPPLNQVAAAAGGLFGRATFWTALGATILGWLLGLVIACVIGIFAGVLIAGIPVVGKLLNSTIEFLRPIPSVALVPLAVLLAGTTMSATLILVVFASVWQVLIQVIYGVRAVDPVARDTAKSYGLSQRSVFVKVTWPSMLPYLFVGIRLAAVVALILEITGELVIGSPGLGKLITVAQSSAAIPQMYALVWVSALLGIGVSLGARLLERRLLHWHASIRSELA